MVYCWLFDGGESPRQFETLAELARACGVSRNTMNNRVRRGATGDAHWRSIKAVGGRPGRPVMWTHTTATKRVSLLCVDDVIDAEDGETVEYENIAQLATVLGVAYSTAHTWLARGYTSTRQAVMAGAMNHSKGEVVWKGVRYASVAHMARALGVAYQTAQAMLSGTKPKKSRKSAKPIVAKSAMEILRERHKLLQERKK